MSEMGFYSLPTGKLHKKTKKSRLKNFPTGYVDSFYRNFTNNVDNFLGSECMGELLMTPIYHQKMCKIYPCNFWFR